MRKPFRHFRFVCCLALLLAAVIQGHASATTLARMSIEQMSRTAPLIVRARCIGNSTGWDAGEIWTFTNFEIEETWRGSVTTTATVRLLGGRSGNITSSVSGVPRFRAGEDVILFLEPTPRGDFSVVSWAQGTLRIRRDLRTGTENVTQDTASTATFDPTTQRYTTNGVRNLALSDFRTQVIAALRTIRSKP